MLYHIAATFSSKQHELRNADVLVGTPRRRADEDVGVPSNPQPQRCGVELALHLIDLNLEAHRRFQVVPAVVDLVAVGALDAVEGEVGNRETRDDGAICEGALERGG